MFTWICPKCGRDVPPSYSDCPDCTPKPPKAAAPEPKVTAAAPPPVAAEPVQPPPVAAVPVEAPPVAAAPLAAPPVAEPVATPAVPASAPTPPHLQSAPWPPPAAAPNPYLECPSSFAAAQPPEVRRKGPPGWLIAIGFAVGLAGVLFLLYTYVLPKKSETASTPGTSAAAGSVVPAAAKAGGAKRAHPLAKFLEITGVRFTEDAKQRGKVQFIVVNHSAADLPELKMQIAVKAAGKTVFEIPFSVPSIGPYESKDFSVPVQTSLKGYELPDWQFLKADFEITSEP